MEKEKELKINSEQTGSDTNLKCCPGCQSETVWRIQRSETEKIICFLSKGEYIIKKYVCKACGGITLLHRTGNEYIQDAEAGEVTIFPLKCGICGGNHQHFTNWMPGSEMNAADERSTEFKKLICTDCHGETVINRADFEVYNINEF